MPNPVAFGIMKDVLSVLGNPERDFKAIHIAGTNGKGSVAIMMASILEEAGYSVGLYTSPHLELEAERVQVWDKGFHKMIPQDHFDELMDRVRDVIHEIDAEYSSVFMIYTAAAYLYFAETKPDYVVLECGVGGRLDMTNTIKDPVVSVFTQIGLDHTQSLGNTIFRITREKAGIIKPGVPVVSQTPDLTVKNILRRTAEENGCSFTDASMFFDNYRKYSLAMRGEHQLRNAATAAEAIKASGIDVSEKAIASGLSKAVNPGRFEVISEKPYWIIDGSHNPDAIEALIETFSRFTREKNIKRTLLIFGCMRDKNSRRMVQLLTGKGNMRGVSFAAVAIDYERAEDPETLAGMFADAGRGCTYYQSAEEAFSEAMASDFECILITGSIYLAGTMRGYFFNN